MKTEAHRAGQDEASHFSALLPTAGCEAREGRQAGGGRPLLPGPGAGAVQPLGGRAGAALQHPKLLQALPAARRRARLLRCQGAPRRLGPGRAQRWLTGTGWVLQLSFLWRAAGCPEHGSVLCHKNTCSPKLRTMQVWSPMEPDGLSSPTWPCSCPGPRAHLSPTLCPQPV